jgi:oxygen-independent coproporphyrinogen-3 oxidase
MQSAGFEHYEVSNWAKPKRECRHNLNYWRNGDWLGLGAGAHSHLFGERFAGAASPSRYIALVNESEVALPNSAALAAMRHLTMREAASDAREMSETVFLALRLREGLDLQEFEDRFGVEFGQVFADALAETQAIGLTEIVDGRLRLRDEAVLLGDEAFVRFLSPKTTVEGSEMHAV